MLYSPGWLTLMCSLCRVHSIKALLAYCTQPSSASTLLPNESVPLRPMPHREVLEELQRLMPGADAVHTLLSDPSWLLRVERGTRRLGEHPE